MEKSEVKIGLLGLGTVGTGVVKLLRENETRIRDRLGAELRLYRIAIRDPQREREVSFGGEVLTADLQEVVTDPRVEIVVELIGGYEPARQVVLEAIRRGKDVVTANKALLATHGREIFAAAEAKGVSIGFEASVAGGIPIIRTLREGLAGDRSRAVFGILNGTSNYILTTMTDEGGGFAEVLQKAQSMGIAEADPGLDIDGVDAAHKLALLVSLAFGAQVPFEDVYVEGIRDVSQLDILFAREFGYRVKLLAIAKDNDTTIEVRVHPTLIPHRSLLAQVGGAYNAIYIEGDASGSTMYFGPGAGMMPTATAVVADLIEVARNRLLAVGVRVPPLGCPWSRLRRVAVQSMDELISEYYLRFMAVDRPGVLAKISGILGEHHISIASVLQKERKQGDTVPVVIRTHEARERDLKDALARIDQLPVVSAKSIVMRIEERLG